MVGVPRVLENKMRYRQKRKILLPPLCELVLLKYCLVVSLMSSIFNMLILGRGMKREFCRETLTCGGRRGLYWLYSKTQILQRLCSWQGVVNYQVDPLNHTPGTQAGRLDSSFPNPDSYVSWYLTISPCGITWFISGTLSPDCNKFYRKQSMLGNTIFIAS